jgi:hypothetical protein
MAAVPERQETRMILEDAPRRGLQHCETSTLGVLLRHQGLELSEPMMFGLGAGLSFIYWDRKGMPMPFLGGRVRPFELTTNLCDRLGLALSTQETSSRRKAWQNVTSQLDAGRPVGLQLDSYHLPYFTPPRVHFAGHMVAMYGYDDERAYVVDTDQQGGAVTVDLESLAAARAERAPMTAPNRSFTVTVPATLPPLREAAAAAIRDCASTFLDPPIANLGHRGIAKAAKLVVTWLDRSADPARDLPQVAALMERGGTGGALFRNLYRDFLAECAELIDDEAVRVGHERYGRAATLWTEVAGLIAQAGESGDEGRLRDASAVLSEIAQLEREAMTALVAVET